MKIVILGTSYFCYTKSLINALILLGHDITFIEIPFFKSEDLEFAEYIKYRLGAKKYKKYFIDDYIAKMKKTVLEVQPDIFISLGANNHIEHLSRQYLLELKNRGIKLVSWHFDSVQRFHIKEQHFELFDEIYSLEDSDKEFIEKNYNTKYYFMPIGVAEEVYCKDDECRNKKYDICFVGGASPNRLKLLNKIAAYCLKNKRSLYVSGPFWNKNHWWKNLIGYYKFKIQYPHLAKYIVNREMQPEELSNLYRESKICLNIHVPVHKNTNPRTFEILGNGNFELCDYRKDSDVHGLINGENIVYYNDDEDAISKIDFYIENDDLRTRIGKNGKILVSENCTMRRCLERFASHLFDLSK